jgi:hypothetical protein
VCRETKCCILSLGRKGCDERRHFAFLVFEDATLRNLAKRMTNIYCLLNLPIHQPVFPPQILQLIERYKVRSLRAAFFFPLTFHHEFVPQPKQ